MAERVTKGKGREEEGARFTDGKGRDEWGGGRGGRGGESKLLNRGRIQRGRLTEGRDGWG